METFFFFSIASKALHMSFTYLEEPVSSSLFFMLLAVANNNMHTRRLASQTVTTLFAYYKNLYVIF